MRDRRWKSHQINRGEIGYGHSVAGLKHNGYMFPAIQQTRVIIWDEVPM